MTVIDGMSNADYHSHAAVSKTQLDQIAKSPAHFKHARESETESTQAMIFGSAFHDFILLPEVFAESYASCLMTSMVEPKTAKHIWQSLKKTARRF